MSFHFIHTAPSAVAAPSAIKYYDSKLGLYDGEYCLGHLLHYLQDEYLTRQNEELPKDWELIPCKVQNTPHQENGCDCGVFMSFYCMVIAAGIPTETIETHLDEEHVTFEFNQSDIPNFRWYMISCILQGILKE